jgi:hypothetical protein
MTDRAQFEAMLEALINEDHEQAKEIFHNIVVGKSREIYEEILAEDFSPEEANSAIGGHSKNEGMEDEEDTMEEEAEDDAEDDAESDSEDDSEEPEDDGEEMPFDDEEGDEEGDMGDMGDDSNGDMEDRVMDLEDALEDLKAEFEQLLAGEDAEEHDHPGIHDMGGMDAMGGDDMGGDMDELETMMEYVNKVASPKHGDNGVNTKSIIDNMKNDMGGTTANIAKNFSTTSGGTQGGLLKPTTGDLTAGLGTIQNRVDSKAGKTAFKKQEPGHGAEKAGKKETADNKQSMLNGAPKRNK